MLNGEAPRERCRLGAQIHTGQLATQRVGPPVRVARIGCGHFRTDISYLPCTALSDTSHTGRGSAT